MDKNYIRYKLFLSWTMHGIWVNQFQKSIKIEIWFIGVLDEKKILTKKFLSKGKPTSFYKSSYSVIKATTNSTICRKNENYQQLFQRTIFPDQFALFFLQQFR